jgi:hypothetical protein
LFDIVTRDDDFGGRRIATFAGGGTFSGDLQSFRLWCGRSDSARLSRLRGRRRCRRSCRCCRGLRRIGIARFRSGWRGARSRKWICGWSRWCGGLRASLNSVANKRGRKQAGENSRQGFTGLHWGGVHGGCRQNAAIGARRCAWMTVWRNFDNVRMLAA